MKYLNPKTEINIIYTKSNKSHNQRSFQINRSSALSNAIKSIISLCVVVFFLSSPVFVQAAKLGEDALSTNRNQEASPCFPLDIVLLVDQSEDMFNDDAGGARYDLTRWVLNFLGYDHIFLCPDTINHLTVINFGANPVINGDPTAKSPLIATVPKLNWYPVQPIPDQGKIADWVLETQTITKDLEDTNSMGLRDFRMALKEAGKLLKGSDPEAKKVVILISDYSGGTCTELKRNVTSNNCSYTSEGSYFKEIANILDNNLSFMTDEGPYIWVLAYSPLEENKSLKNFGVNQNDIIDKWNYISNSHNNVEFIQIENLSAINLIQPVLERLLTLGGRQNVNYIKDGKISVDPFLERLGLFIAKEKENSKDPLRFTVISTYGVNLTKKSSEIGGQSDQLALSYPESPQNPDQFEFYLFEAPASGKWSVSFPPVVQGTAGMALGYPVHGSRVDIVQPSTPLPQYQDPELSSDPDHPYYLIVNVTDRASNAPLHNASAFAADITGELKTPGGKTTRLTFRPTESAYESVEALPTNETGDYTVRITVKAPALSSSNSFIPLIEGDVTYKVVKVQPFYVKIETPQEDESILAHFTWFENRLANRPFQVVARLVGVDETGKEGAPIKNTDVVSGDPKKVVKLTLYNIETEQTQNVYMNPDPVDQSLYRGWVGDQFADPGVYKVMVNYVGDYDKVLHRLSATEGSSSEPRDDSIISVLLRKDTISTSRTWHAGFAIFILAVLLIDSGWLIRRFSNPVIGRLKFYRPKVSPYDDEKLEPFAEFELGRWFNRLRYVHFRPFEIRRKSRLLSNLGAIKAQMDSDYPDSVYIDSDSYNGPLKDKDRVKTTGGYYMEYQRYDS